MTELECLYWTVLFTGAVTLNLIIFAGLRKTQKDKEVYRQYQQLKEQGKIQSLGERLLNLSYEQSLIKDSSQIPIDLRYKYRNRVWRALNKHFEYIPSPNSKFYEFLGREYEQPSQITGGSIPIWIATGLLTFGRKDVIYSLVNKIIEAKSFTYNKTFLPIIFYLVGYADLDIIFVDNPEHEKALVQWLDDNMDYLEWDEEQRRFVLNKPDRSTSQMSDQDI